MNKSIVVDIDGVLADFESSFCREFGEDRRELESLESRYPKYFREINRFVSDPLTYNNLEPISLGLAIVEWLNHTGYDVNIITSRPPEAEWVTRKWLKKHGVKFLSFGVYPNKIPRIGEMAPICAIDDLISVSRHLEAYNVPVLMHNQPWNWFYEYKNRVFSNLNQFMTAFSKISTH